MVNLPIFPRKIHQKEAFDCDILDERKETFALLMRLC